MTPTTRKKLIEVSIPLDAINVASAKEKSIRHGHPSTLHLWWARRPLAACRAVIFAQLVDDPSGWPDKFPTEAAQETERKRLHKVIADMVPWEASNNDTIINAARFEIARSVAWGLGEEPPPATDAAAVLDYLQTKAPPVYDPFCGGGSIPLEAQRLGLRAYGSDLNPVAVLISKALVEIPPKFTGRPPVNPAARDDKRLIGRTWRGSQGLADDVRHYGKRMRDEAEKRIGHFYPKVRLDDGTEATVIAWLWARTVASPDPIAKGAHVPLVSSFLLSSKNNKKSWVEVVRDATAQDGWRFEVANGELSKEREAALKLGTKLGTAQAFRCVLTGSPIERAYIQAQGKAKLLRERLLAIVAEGSRTRSYLSPNPRHEGIAVDAGKLSIVEDSRVSFLSGSTPTRAMITGGVCSAYGLETWGELFTDRQLVALTTFSDLVTEAKQWVLDDAASFPNQQDDAPLSAGGRGVRAYAEAVATYLAFAVSKSTTRSCSLALWEAGMGRLAGAFGRQSFPMQWSFAETNPLAGAGGDIAGTAVSVAENLDNLGYGASATIDQGVAQKNNYPVLNAVFCTDPPYYDNIGYADLSDFFYVWLRRCLSQTWPDLFRTLETPKVEELVATPARHGGRQSADEHFMEGMLKTFAAIHHAAKNDLPLSVYYAFKQSEAVAEGISSAGWSSFLQAIVDSEFLVDGTWPVRSEATNALKKDVSALASSIVMVLRKRPADASTVTREELVRALKRELPHAIDDIRIAGVGPVDMEQAVIGPGMGVFSRYSSVLEDDGTSMRVATALAIIN